jgi:hypothetical protein
MVVSVAGDDVPTTTGMTANTMEFRIQKWTLNRDWSVTFYGSTTHDDMYDIVAGPKPEDVEALPIQEEPFRDMYTPSQPYFDVAMYPKDPGAALISNLHFPDVPHNENTSSMKHGAFTFLYVKSDEYAPILSSGIDADDTSITLNNTYHVTEGDLRLIDGEIVLFGAPSGNTVPITRGLYTSTAVAHDAASRVYLLHSKVESVSFPSNFFHGTKYPYWTDIVRLPNTRVAVVLATMTNDYGDSPQGINLLTNNEEYGLVLYDTTYPVLLHSDTEVADVSDPIWDENEHTFGLQQAYESTSDGNMTASLVVNTKMPIREFLENTDAPLIGGTSTTGSGGSLPDNTTYMISVCAYNADGYTPVSDLQVVKTGAGGGDNKITLSGITWPEGTYDGYVVFAAQSDLRLICAQDEVEDTLPSSINFTGPWKRSTWNMPSVDFRKVIVKAKKVWHSGVLGSQVTSVSTNTIVCSALANLGDDWSGRVLTILANVDDTTSVKNFSITGYTDSTGTFTCSPDPLAAGVEVDDVFVVRFKADTITSTSIGDSGLISGVYPDGDIPDHKVGKYVWVILGTGRGQIRKITANTATTYTIDRPWKVTPNSSSTWIIVEPSWQYRAESEIPESYDKTALAALPITAANLGRQTYCVAGFIRDVNGVETPEDLVLPREFWLFGALGNVISTERLTFNFQGDLENPDTVDVPLPVTLSQNTLAEVYEVWATISTPAVGADIVFDLKWSEDGGVTWADSLFPSTRTLPAGETSLVYRGEDLAADPLLLRRSFWVKPYISGIGSTTPGADLSITVRYRIREDNTSEVGGRIGRLGGASYQRGTATNTGYKLRGTIPVGV